MASTAAHTWKTPVPGQRACTVVEVMVKVAMVAMAAMAAAMATTKTTVATAMAGVTQQSTE